MLVFLCKGDLILGSCFVGDEFGLVKLLLLGIKGGFDVVVVDLLREEVVGEEVLRCLFCGKVMYCVMLFLLFIELFVVFLEINLEDVFFEENDLDFRFLCIVFLEGISKFFVCFFLVV